MNKIKFLALAAIAAFAIASGTPKAAAQINFYIGVAPVCPYGYYDYAPHNCAPDGYYGPEWFKAGVFIGADSGEVSWAQRFPGPGRQHLLSPIRDSGPLPNAGDKPSAQRRAPEKFRGNEVRDGRGNIRGERQGGENVA